MFPSAAVDDGRPKFRELRKGNARFAAEARDGRSHPTHLGKCEGPIQLMETLKKKSMISQKCWLSGFYFAKQRKRTKPCGAPWGSFGGGLSPTGTSFDALLSVSSSGSNSNSSTASLRSYAGFEEDAGAGSSESWWMMPWWPLMFRSNFTRRCWSSGGIQTRSPSSVSSRLENSTFELHWPVLFAKRTHHSCGRELDLVVDVNSSFWFYSACLSPVSEDTLFVLTLQPLNLIFGLIVSCVHEWEEEVCVYSLSNMSNMRPYEYVTIRVYAIILRS